MALGTFTVRSEREGGQAVLTLKEDNVDGAFNVQGRLPAGFGDCYIIRVGVHAAPAATLMTNPEIYGPRWSLTDEAGAVTQDYIGHAQWVRSLTDPAVTASYQPFIAVLWRFGETLDVIGAEVDTNITPTVDFTSYVLVHRRQNMPVGRAAQTVFVS